LIALRWNKNTLILLNGEIVVNRKQIKPYRSSSIWNCENGIQKQSNTLFFQEDVKIAYKTRSSIIFTSITSNGMNWSFSFRQK